MENTLNPAGALPMPQHVHVHNYGLSDLDYNAFVETINQRFNSFAGDTIFETDATGLWDAYLKGFPEGPARQYHNCDNCQAFIKRFGALAVVNESGGLVPVMWDADNMPELYRTSMEGMERLVRRAKLVVPYFSAEPLLGVPENVSQSTGILWHHMAVRPSDEMLYVPRSALSNAWKDATNKREEFNSVMLALKEYTRGTCESAVRLLKAETLLQASASALPGAQFLLDLHIFLAEKHQGENLVYEAVTKAPSGFCHPRTGVIATLLDNLQSGMSFDEVRRQWNDYNDPLKKGKRIAPPTEGAVREAEKAFEILGAASALRRCWAGLDDIQDKMWTPKERKGKEGGGIFGSVKTKQASSGSGATVLDLPTVTMTWEKFRRTVLDTADEISFYAANNKHNFNAFTKAEDPDSYPILQWDSLEQRNTVIMYGYSERVGNSGSLPGDFNLMANKYHKVVAVAAQPSQWNGLVMPHLGEAVCLFIENAADGRQANHESAIFSPTLKSELHPFLSVIEAYSKDNPVKGSWLDGCASVTIGKGGSCNVVLRVTSGGQTAGYKIDRWD